MVMFAIFKEQKRSIDDKWIDAEVEPVDLLPNRKLAMIEKKRLESMNNRNEPHLTRFKIQPEQI